ncbi:MAG TPA: hypothetical protein VF791_11300 [Pyrinomonadaceae bacterium]
MSRKPQPNAPDASHGSAVENNELDFSLKRNPLLWGMFAAILLFYLLFLTKNYYWDGIFFAQTIENAPDLNPSLLHPNHLLYNVLGHFVYRLTQGVGLNLRAVEVLQIINCLFGAASAYLLFRILVESLKSIYLSASLTLIFAFSAVWWKFSTDADSYIPSVFFLLICFRLILPGRKPRPFLVALAHALSMFFHQLAIFFFPVILLGIYFQASDGPKNRRIIPVAKYCVTAFLITFPVFYLGFYLVADSLAFKPFLRWITTFSPEHGFTFNAWDNLTFTLRGHSRLLVGGRISFLRDLKSPLMIGLVIVLSILVALLFYKLIRHFGELKRTFRSAVRDASEYRPLRLICLVWIGCYLIFLYFFIPQNTFYRLFYLPGIIVLLGTFLAPYETIPGRVRRFRTLLLAGAVFVANLAFTAYPYSLVRANPPLALALELNKAWPPGTIIYFAEWNSDNFLVKYFNPATRWKQADLDTLQREAQETAKAGASVWIETTFIERYLATPEGGRWLEAHTVRRPEYELVNDKYKLRFYQLKTDSIVPPVSDHQPEGRP